jgi:capsule biosynthesis phosphatase
MGKVKRIIVDLDDTLCRTPSNDYRKSVIDFSILEKLNHYKSIGFEIVISTSRNVRTYEGNIGKINANTLPIIVEWLRENSVPFDEIYIGKPWCGDCGFYIDDKAIRPSEFKSLSYDEIIDLLGKEKE